MREAIKQPRLSPWSLAGESAALFALREGLLDPVPVEKVAKLLEELARHLKEVDPDLVDDLERGDALTPSMQEQLRRHIETVQRLHPETEAS